MVLFRYSEREYVLIASVVLASACVDPSLDGQWEPDWWPSEGSAQGGLLRDAGSPPLALDGAVPISNRLDASLDSDGSQPNLTSDEGGLAEPRIVAWGDSLTARYAARLAAATGRKVVNLGVGGQGSSGIAARQGGIPAFITFANNEIPQTGAAGVDTLEPSLLMAPGQSIRGSVLGVLGSLLLRQGSDGTNVLEFFPESGEVVDVVSAPPRTSFVPDTDQYRHDLSVFWMGRNNYKEVQRVLADVAACINHLKSDRYLVLSVLNGAYPSEVRGGLGYEQIIAINANLAALYGERYVDVRTPLVEAFDPNDAVDTQNHADDVPPRSLRVDDVHLAWTGNELVAEVVAGRLSSLGW